MSFSNPRGSASGTAAPSTKNTASVHKRRSSTSEAEQHGSSSSRNNQHAPVGQVLGQIHISKPERDSRHSGPGKRPFIVGVADDNGYDWPIVKIVDVAGAEILVGTWVPIC
ncbi:hypothetical protein GUJ93_ZPchr0002g23333 [Zizania palustris]|uniref:Uncharacterized protein n=1 Tax=Zizania palustris TaxID=103762 RepID=A0A8J5VQM0_ZIZPA|nr:hypothetical protein GUJ93_ZPchr0002g23333 [Zizania palustris]